MGIVVVFVSMFIMFLEDRSVPFVVASGLAPVIVELVWFCFSARARRVSGVHIIFGSFCTVSLTLSRGSGASSGLLAVFL